jgi:membrane-associated phospholipid phosphatase
MNEILIKILADGTVLPVVVIGALVLIFGIPNREKYQAYCRMLLAGLTAYATAKLIGFIYQPESLRPFEQLGVDAGASFMNNPGFPSDHVLFCMVIVLAVWFETKYKRLAIILFVLTLLVGIGRVVALVHTPLDVIGGVVIACAGIPWYLQNATKLTKSHASTNHTRKKIKKSVK